MHQVKQEVLNWLLEDNVSSIDPVCIGIFDGIVIINCNFNIKGFIIFRNKKNEKRSTDL